MTERKVLLARISHLQRELVTFLPCLDSDLGPRFCLGDKLTFSRTLNSLVMQLSTMRDSINFYPQTEETPQDDSCTTQQQ